MVDPAWRTVVAPDHREYMQEILSDFQSRAQTDPETLFEQAGRVSVGPLVTCQEGTDLSRSPRLLEKSKTFRAFAEGSSGQ